MNAARTTAAIPATYRAVVAFFPNGEKTVLTAPADADKPEVEMLRLARHEARFACIDFDSTDIRVTTWTDLCRAGEEANERMVRLVMAEQHGKWLKRMQGIQ